MADDEYPRVASLAYRIVSDETHDYAKQAEFDGELQGFQFGLRQRFAQFTPQLRFATEEEAAPCSSRSSERGSWMRCSRTAPARSNSSS